MKAVRLVGNYNVPSFERKTGSEWRQVTPSLVMGQHIVKLSVCSIQ